MLRLTIFLFLFLYPTSVLPEKNYFLMLKNNKVNVRYGPSFDYPIKYVYKKRFLPVKIIDKKENFRRIIDHKKNSGWIHRTQLKKSKSLIVLEDKLIFKENSRFSEPLVKIKKGRLLFVKKCLLEWCSVKTDNYSGWIELENVWGFLN
tara:strand:- start:2363 stop:2806 length:444 start_codon:yes stop_codon:yes gene_type:complete